MHRQRNILARSSPKESRWSDAGVLVDDEIELLQVKQVEILTRAMNYHKYPDTYCNIFILHSHTAKIILRK